MSLGELLEVPEGEANIDTEGEPNIDTPQEEVIPLLEKGLGKITPLPKKWVPQTAP